MFKDGDQNGNETLSKKEFALCQKKEAQQPRSEKRRSSAMITLTFGFSAALFSLGVTISKTASNIAAHCFSKSSFNTVISFKLNNLSGISPNLPCRGRKKIQCRKD